MPYPYSIDHYYIAGDDGCICQIKIILSNVVIRNGSGTLAISKMKLFVAIALHWKPLTFFVENLILDRR